MTKRKRNWRVMRFRKNDPSHNLLAAATHWIKANGGTAVVIGGTGVREWAPFKYEVVISCVGQKPQKKGA